MTPHDAITETAAAVPFELTATVPAAARRPDPERYRTAARPELGRLLRALGLDVVYVSARGDRMVYEHKGVRGEVTDLMGGYGASLFGHHHPALAAELRACLDEAAPVQAQASCRAWAGELAHALGERLTAATEKRYVVTLANTGAEAVEAALKHAELERFEQARASARKFRRRMNGLLAEAEGPQEAFLREVSREIGLGPGAGVREALEAVAQANEAAHAASPVYFALEKAFHGKTTGAVQVTYNEAYRAPFARVGLRCEFLPADDARAWERAVARATVRTWEVACREGHLELAEKPWVNVSAIVIEPLQGEGGIHPLSAEAAGQIRALASQHGIPLVIDEIQSGMGRCGSFLASSRLGVVGDYYLFAKSLGGGLTKVAALAIEARRYVAEFGVLHTSTFAEDDFSARVALRALALLDEAEVPARCERLGADFLAKLEALVARHPGVLAAARGWGLMLGLEFRPQHDNPSNAIRMLSDQGYLGYVVAGYLLHEEGFRVAPTLSAAAVIRLEPSAFIDPAELDRFCGAIDRLATILERGNAYRLVRYTVGLADPGDPAPIRDYGDQPRRLHRQAPACEKRVAFIGHFITAKEPLIWDPSLAEFPEGALERFQMATHRIFGPSFYDGVHVQSAIGETVHLATIGINLTSKAIETAMRERDTDWIVAMVEEAVAMARDAGCQVVGLGGYTSIVTDNGKRIGERGIAITTGNSLTVGMGLAALGEGAASLGIALEEATVGIVGATGNIGKVYAEMLAESAPRLVLIGREAGSRLQRIAGQLYEQACERLAAGAPATGLARVVAKTEVYARWQAAPLRGEPLFAALSEELGEAAPIRISSDPAALRACRLIVAASNSAKPVIQPEHLGAEPAVIIDLSVPEDVAPELAETRPDVLVIKGGLVAIPGGEDFRIAAVPLPDGEAFACMSETMLLGLMGAREDFSYGPVQPARVKQAMAWADVNGFGLAGFKVERSY